MSETNHKGDALYMLEGWERRGREMAAKMSAGLLVDPQTELEWCNDSFRSSGRLSVVAVLRDLVETKGLAVAAGFARSEALRGARWPQHSTSPAVNLACECRTAAFAEFAMEAEAWL